MRCARLLPAVPYALTLALACGSAQAFKFSEEEEKSRAEGHLFNTLTPNF